MFPLNKPHDQSLRNKNYFINKESKGIIEKTFNNAPNVYIKYGREKEIRLMLEHIQPSINDKILCVGIGSGWEANILLNYINSPIYGVDISSGYLSYCSQRFGRKFIGDLCDIESEETPYKDNYFDKIVCLNVLPFFSEAGLNNFTKEISRIIKNDGRVFAFILNKLYPFSSLIQKQMINNRIDKNMPIYFYKRLSNYNNIFRKHGFKITGWIGGDIWCDVNTWFFKWLFNSKWEDLIIRFMERGCKNSLKRYYRSIYLMLHKV